MLNRILVGVDFTAQSEVLIAHAQDMARRHGAEIVLAHVLHLGFDTPLVELAGAGDWDDLALMQQEQIRQQLSHLCALLDPEIVSSALLLEGKPAPSLAVAADELDADLVMLGSHGRTGLQRFLIGSVAERTVRFADRTIMIVKGKSRPRNGFHRILVPTDFSQAAEQALEASFCFAAPGAHIELLHCWTTPVYLGTLEDTNLSMAALGPEIEREVKAQGERLLAAYRAQGAYSLGFAQVENKATHAIQDRLSKEPFDLVVMGNHGRSGLGRWLIGSVAEVTVRHAPCSVIVVKTGEQDDD